MQSTAGPFSHLDTLLSTLFLPAFWCNTEPDQDGDRVVMYGNKERAEGREGGEKKKKERKRKKKTFTMHSFNYEWRDLHQNQVATTKQTQPETKQLIR
jgi:hypothetical protein